MVSSPKEGESALKYKVRDLTYSYPGQGNCLNKINFEISGPGVVTVMGPSGAGKSTLIKCLSGVINPSSGNISLYVGDDQKPSKTINKECAIVWQDGGLVERLNALYNVMIGDLERFSLMGASCKKFPAQERTRAWELLSSLRLSGKWDRQVRELSGGERQRVAIARAFYRDSPIIFADEPIASLDPQLAEEVMTELVTLARERNKLLILSLHQIEAAMKYSDRIIGIRDGKISYDSIRDRFNLEKLNALFQVNEKNNDKENKIDDGELKIAAPRRRGLVKLKNTEPVSLNKWPNWTLNQMIITFLSIGLIGFAMSQTEVSLSGFVNGGPKIFEFLGQLFPPDFEMDRREIGFGRALFFPLELPRVVWVTWETILMAITGTWMGGLVALPLSLLAARNVTPAIFIYWVTRIILNANRAIPDIVYALVMVSAVGLGPFAGTLALAIGSIGSMAKVFSEVIESVNRRPVESLEATGAHSWLVFRFGIIPQALPVMASYTILYFEHNVRSATILGLVGAGGIGFVIHEYYQLFQYEKLCSAIILIIVTVSLLDKLSDSIRKRLL